MLAQWTAAIIGKMHINKVSAKELSAEVGWHPKYTSAVLNGHKCPSKAEEKLNAALDRIIERKNSFKVPKL